MQTYRRPFDGVPRARQRGITLVEMMVAATVGLILLAGISQLFVSNKHAYRIQEGANVLNENSRYALNQLQYHLRLADHWGGVESSDIAVDAGVAALATDCAESPAVSGAGIVGFDGVDDSPLSCIPDADYAPNTDVIVIRYGGPERVAVDTVKATGATLFVRTGLGLSGLIFEGGDFDDALDPAGAHKALLELDTGDDYYYQRANYLFHTVVYFIRRCASQDRGTADECDAADDTTPTLARLVLGVDEDGVYGLHQEDVIAGVEQLQATYGVDTNADSVADHYRNADEVTAEDAWERVIDVRLSVVIRNPERDTSFEDTRTYTLYGGVAGAGVDYEAPSDARQYRRKVVNTTVQIRNLTRG